MSGRYKLKWLCEAFLVSRSGYYDWRQRRRAPGPRARENLELRLRIREEFARSRQTYGSPRLTRVLQGAASRNRVARLMRVERLWARQRSKYRVATTDSRHRDPIAVTTVGGGHAILRALPGPEPFDAHQAGHAIAARRALQHSCQTRAPIRLPTARKLFSDAQS